MWRHLVLVSFQSEFWKTAAVSLNQIVSGQLIIIALGKVRHHQCGDIVLGEVVVNDGSILIVDRVNAAALEWRQDSIRFLGAPLLRNAKPQFVNVHVEVRVELFGDLVDPDVGCATANATVEESLIVLLLIVGHVNTFHRRAMVIGLCVLVEVPIIKACSPVGHGQVKLLETSIFIRARSIMAHVTWQVDNGIGELRISSSTGHDLTDVAWRHHWLKRRQFRHDFSISHKLEDSSRH